MLRRNTGICAAALTAVISCSSVQAMPITAGTTPPPTIPSATMNHVQLAQWGHRYYWRGSWHRAYWRNGHWYGHYGPGWRRGYHIAPAGYAYGPSYGAYGPGYWRDDHWHNDAAFILPGLILLGIGVGIGAAVF